MARKGVTQTTLARHLELTQPAISARLRGKTPFNVDELTKVADVLDVPLSRLLPSAEPVTTP